MKRSALVALGGCFWIIAGVWMSKILSYVKKEGLTSPGPVVSGIPKSQMSQKTVYILRHAKTEAGTPEGDDHARQLTPNGWQAAIALGAELARRKFHVDRVICSTAKRAVQTLEGLQQGIGHPLESETQQKLYLCSPAEMLNLLRVRPESEQSIMLIGHNPGMHQFSLDMAAFGDEEALDDLSLRFPTCALVTLTIPRNWQDMAFRTGTLEEYLTRHDLTQGA